MLIIYEKYSGCVFSVYVLTKQLDVSDSDMKKVWMHLIKLEKVIHYQVMIFLCIFILQFSIFLSVIFLSVSSQNPILVKLMLFINFFHRHRPSEDNRDREGAIRDISGPFNPLMYNASKWSDTLQDF